MTEKFQLYKMCLAKVEKSIQAAQEALDSAIAAGNEETKSSVGDKYETGRAMAQMEQDKNRSILSKAIILKNKLLQLNPEKKHDKIEEGALVITDIGNYYISTSIGKIVLNKKLYYAISAEAPLAKSLWGKTKSSSVVFQNKKYSIIDIC
ncbi:MAG: 3-oxoacyl-ACP synthase [Bacteroidota bacterium]